MRIVFLGSSHGVPEPNRRCSSILVEVGENRYFIDMGTQSIEDLATRRIPAHSVKGIFITHLHGDHTNGLFSFVDLCSWYYKKADPEIFLPEPVDTAVEIFGSWMKLNGTNMREFRFSPVKEGLLFDDGAVRVTAYKTKHIANSYAYLFEAEGKRVLFGGDMSVKGPADDFPFEVLNEPLDLAVCEAAHFAATDFVPIFADRDVKQICMTHYSDRYLASVLELKAALPDKNVFRTSDNMEINL